MAATSLRLQATVLWHASLTDAAAADVANQMDEQLLLQAGDDVAAYRVCLLLTSLLPIVEA